MKSFDWYAIVVVLAMTLLGIVIIVKGNGKTSDSVLVEQNDIKIKGHDYIDVVSHTSNGDVHCPVHSPECRKCYVLFD